ncbi:MAG TPA: DUF1800 domain-containing protein [Rhizomicrobium sp.]|nr:DUF1800 domain-containing protein [Rhizomicrobium sp.]
MKSKLLLLALMRNKKPNPRWRTILRTALAVLLLAGLTACGKGGGGGGNMFGGSSSSSSSSSTPAISSSDAARFLTQATFGPTDSDITALTISSFATWLSTQTSAPVSSPTHQAWVDQQLTQLQATNPSATLSANQFYESFWQHAVQAPDELRQRVKFALSQIFVISLADPNVDVRGAASYYDMLGADAFGNFRQLLTDVTYHPMMGVYLTYMSNQKEDPNGTRTPDQNYARELMQLMTIGLYKLNPDGTNQLDGSGNPIPTYSQNDILGLAKVFTGLAWYSPNPTTSTFNGGNKDPNATITPMIAYPQFHSTSEKDFLGVTILATSTPDTVGDVKIALDTLFNHPNVGPFISFRLIQQLVTSNPSPAYVQRVASVFNNNGSGVRGDMTAVITAILTDTEARTAANETAPGFGKLREPVVRLANWMRAFSVTSQSGNWLMTSTSASTSLGESPLTSSSVFNFWRPGYAPPNTQLAANNLLAPEFQSVNEVTNAGYLNTMQGAIGNGIGSVPSGGSGADIQSQYSAETAVANDASALADLMNRLLLYGQMSSTLHQRLVDAVNGVAIPGGSATQAQINAALLNRAKIAVFLTMASNEYLAQR